MKRSFLPGSGHIDTAIWLHYMDANKTAGEEARRQLHKNATCNLKQVPGDNTPTRTPTVRPPTPITKTIQVRRARTCRTLLEKQGRTHKRCTLMDPHTWPCKKQDDQHEHTFSSYVRIRDVVLKTYLGAMNDREEWRERVKDICATSAIWWWWFV